MKVARALLVAAACVLPAADDATAHLRPIGGSLVELVQAADAIVLAEALAPTVDRRDVASGAVAETRFRTIEPIAGASTDETFTAAASVPPLRYAAAQRAFVLLERSARGWQATQPAGMGLVIGAAEAGEGARVLAALWTATRTGEPSADELAPILRRALRAPVPKIRLMAALDLAELVHHDRLGPGERAATRAVQDEAGLDPAARSALATAFSRATPVLERR